MKIYGIEIKTDIRLSKNEMKLIYEETGVKLNPEIWEEIKEDLE